MKSITEFANYTLANGLKAKLTLTADGKTAEEIIQNIGETFKYEGDKLKHFINAIGVAEQNPEKLKRVLVISLAEGEVAPAKALQVEETHYVPEFIVETKYQAPQKADAKGGRSNRGGGNKPSGPKSSPWGMSPEEKAAKNKGAAGKNLAKTTAAKK